MELQTVGRLIKLHWLPDTGEEASRGSISSDIVKQYSLSYCGKLKGRPQTESKIDSLW